MIQPHRGALRIAAALAPALALAPATLCAQGPRAHEVVAAPLTTAFLGEGTTRYRVSVVTGTVTPNDSAAHHVDQTTAVPVFDASITELVVQSLPLAPGYHTILPFDTYELGGLEYDTVRVTGTARVAASGGSRDAWVVTFADPFITSTLWLDRQNRRVLRYEIAPRRRAARWRMVPE